MLSLSSLLTFTDQHWNIFLLAVDARKKQETQAAVDLQTAAQNVRLAWNDAIGQAIAAAIERRAQQHLEFVPILDDVKQIIGDATKQIVTCKDKMVMLIASAVQDGITIDNSGYAHMPANWWQNTIPRMWELYNRTLQVNAESRTLLVQATGYDNMAAAAIYRLMDRELPYVDDGPLDLTDAGISMAVELNSQGGYGDCAVLSMLLSIARDNPDFVREHMKWDPATGTYQVTLYDPNTGQPIVVSVDPNKLQGGARSAGTGDPTWLSIYEQALRQQFGDPAVGGQTLTNPAMALTGKNADYTSNPDFQDMRDTLNQRPPGAVTAGVYADQGPGVDPSKRLVSGHAYSVAGFDANGNIILRNPWGPGGGYIDGTYYPGEVHLTPAEYQRWVGGTSTVRQPF